MNSILTVVCILVPIFGFGANLCSQLFVNIKTSDFIEYFKIGSQDQKRLIMRRSELLSQKLIDESDVISQSGIPKRITRVYDVVFPQDRNLTTKIVIYGEPYIENGIWFIDFKIWSRDWEKDRLIHDRASPYLRRMTLEQFFIIGRNDFVSFLKYRQKFVFVDVGNNKFEMLRIQEVNDLNNEVVVNLSDGRYRAIALQDIIKWNISVKEDELRLFSDFLLAGGRGNILHVSSSLTSLKFEYARNYFIVEKLPDAPNPKLPFLISIEPSLSAAMNQKITIALTGENNGIHAATGTKLGDQTFVNHVLIITPTTHKYIINHELKHIEDKKNNIKEKIIAELKDRFSDGEIGLSHATLLRFFILISEQRAYQTQFESMRRDEELFDFVTVYTYFGAKQISFSDFINKESVHIEFFRENYIVPIKNDLQILKINHYQVWVFLKSLALRYSLPSRDFSLAELFD